MTDQDHEAAERFLIEMKAMITVQAGKALAKAAVENSNKLNTMNLTRAFHQVIVERGNVKSADVLCAVANLLADVCIGASSTAPDTPADLPKVTFTAIIAMAHSFIDSQKVIAAGKLDPDILRQAFEEAAKSGAEFSQEEKERFARDFTGKFSSDTLNN